MRAACDAIRRQYVTSGVTAKGEALGASYPEGAAPVERARRKLGRSRNGKTPVPGPEAEELAADYPAAVAPGTVTLGMADSASNGSPAERPVSAALVSE